MSTLGSKKQESEKLVGNYTSTGGTVTFTCSQLSHKLPDSMYRKSLYIMLHPVSAPTEANISRTRANLASRLGSRGS